MKGLVKDMVIGRLALARSLIWIPTALQRLKLSLLEVIKLFTCD